jgi:hypothetical protein
MENILDGKADTWAKDGILVNFDEKKGTRKTIDDIYASKEVSDPAIKGMYLKIAEKMVAEKFLREKEKETYIFSKDNENRYYWKKANFIDKFMNYMINKP